MDKDGFAVVAGDDAYLEQSSGLVRPHEHVEALVEVVDAQGVAEGVAYGSVCDSVSAGARGDRWPCLHYDKLTCHPVRWQVRAVPVAGSACRGKPQAGAARAAPSTREVGRTPPKSW